MALFHFKVPALLASARFSITKKYLLNVGGVVIATAPRNCRDFVLYVTQTKTDNKNQTIRQTGFNSDLHITEPDTACYIKASESSNVLPVAILSPTKYVYI